LIPASGSLRTSAKKISGCPMQHHYQVLQKLFERLKFFPKEVISERIPPQMNLIQLGLSFSLGDAQFRSWIHITNKDE